MPSFDTLALSLIALAIVAECVRLALWLRRDTAPAPEADERGTQDIAEA
ncbi:MAG: hypothetical protein K0B00_06535 [Rhodobacteraceae bacterium]|nr:hypothetical protein [Paracoccaceae bacterium]